MAGENQQAGGKEDATSGEEEEFVVVEVGDDGKPLQQQGAEVGEPENKGSDDQEEGQEDDADADPEGEEDDDDERVGHAEGEETPEEKRERRRRENKAKRVRNKIAAETKDRIISNQGRMLLELNERLARVEGRSVQYDVNVLAQQLDKIREDQAEAKSTLAKLVKAGDGEGVAEVTEIQMQLREQFRHTQMMLERAKQQADGNKREGQGGDSTGTKTRPQIDPVVREMAQDWANDNPWYGRMTQEEQVLIKRIDQGLVGEGMDPRTEEYWEELTARAKRRFPHYFKAKSNGNPRVNDQDGKGNGSGNSSNKNGGGPRMSQGTQTRRPLGHNEVRITKERKEAMQQAGAWDDPVKRKRMLKSFADWDRANAPQN